MCLGVPGQILSIDTAGPLTMGMVDFGGSRREVCLSYVPDAVAGDFVIVHVGFAIATVDEGEAARTWALLEEAAVFAEIGRDDVPGQATDVPGAR